CCPEINRTIRPRGGWVYPLRQTCAPGSSATSTAHPRDAGDLQNTREPGLLRGDRSAAAGGDTSGPSPLLPVAALSEDAPSQVKVAAPGTPPVHFRWPMRGAVATGRLRPGTQSRGRCWTSPRGRRAL